MKKNDVDPVFDQVRAQVSVQVRHQVWDQVSAQVWNLVSHPLREPVQNLVWALVLVPIWLELRRLHEKE